MHAERRGIPLHTKILLGLVLGAVAGFAARSVFASDPETLNKSADWLKVLGDIFLSLIFMVVVPLLFSALCLGVSELGQAKRVGRVGLRALAMTILLSGIAVVIGMTAINVYNPADRLSDAQKQELIKDHTAAGEKTLSTEPDPVQAKDQPILGIVPKNPLRDAVAAFSGGLLPFMVFGLIFGIALASIDPEKALPVKAFLEGIFEVMLKIIEYAMRFAPIGVFGLMYSSAAKLGIDLMATLGMYVIMVLVTLAIHQFVTYSLVLKYIAKRSPVQFFRQMRTVMATAFATSSSNATLPTALRSAEEDIGLPRDVSAFVLTVGATANQNGTALFEGITIVFLSSMFGVDLTFQQQLMVMGLSIVGGIGTAGVPSGSIPMIAGVLSMFKVPASAVGLVVGIDRIMDMSRTVLNVTGDMTIAACVARMEGEPQAPVAELEDAIT